MVSLIFRNLYKTLIIWIREFVNNPSLSDVTFPIHDTTFTPILCFC
ncbi:BnaA07g08890D [Brassica napus]|uniref:BnaA07g08890D protein n=1 Tax=Brassica napus TaxID=3708 RepID=A0A078FTQ4_BRANA|nr:BnaA07g08890D [Brassica napus]